jgi:tetratricopeptide (TPR) repeat protein
MSKTGFRKIIVIALISTLFIPLFLTFSFCEIQTITKLEEENRKLIAKEQSAKQLEKQFQQDSHGLTAVEWLKRADALWDGEKYTDPKKAIHYLNNAINRQKDNADAYGNRGLAYHELGQYQRAIEDYNEAIRLKPDLALAYNNRGLVYLLQGNNKLGCRDAQKACKLGACKALEWAKDNGYCR